MVTSTSHHPALDLGPLYAAADAVAECAARVRAQQILVGLQGANVRWWGLAAIACRDRLADLAGDLGGTAGRLEQFAARIRSTAATLQARQAVGH